MAERGRPKGSVQRPWTDALRIAAKERVVDGKGGKTTRLRRLADTAFRAAEKGDSVAMRDIGDRLEGKPTQRTETLSLDAAEGPALDFSQLTQAEREEFYALFEKAKPKPAKVVQLKSIAGGQGSSGTGED